LVAGLKGRAGTPREGLALGGGDHHNASGPRAQELTQALAELGTKHISICAGRPQSNGSVEGFPQALLEECGEPAFARYLTPKSTGRQRDLTYELLTSNTDHTHQGCCTPSRCWQAILCGSHPADASLRLGERTS